jgi:hypothetical protein
MSIKTLTVEQKYDLAQKLGTTRTFFLYYFDELPNYKTTADCFDAVNELHFEIFTEYKYSDHNSFKRALSYHHNKTRE